MSVMEAESSLASHLMSEEVEARKRLEERNQRELRMLKKDLQRAKEDSKR